ncbi:hypothetical protein QBC32DRAFT_136916 [Pseudoneurospora amorphoporcata]|uniref:ML-like domain-containing protein n=1 Tax=Pseudoneurospora amorphoporcata TaxID=241081 RepID=A0AAN6SJ90_9PEZI|nr:hypothetical protein QBC32DRAFT_136916 [Pseudoneurospora amorphoporcata]
MDRLWASPSSCTRPERFPLDPSSAPHGGASFGRASSTQVLELEQSLPLQRQSRQTPDQLQRQLQPLRQHQRKSQDIRSQLQGQLQPRQQHQPHNDQHRRRGRRGREEQGPGRGRGPRRERKANHEAARRSCCRDSQGRQYSSICTACRQLPPHCCLSSSTMPVVSPFDLRFAPNRKLDLEDGGVLCPGSVVCGAHMPAGCCVDCADMTSQKMIYSGASSNPASSRSDVRCERPSGPLLTVPNSSRTGRTDEDGPRSSARITPGSHTSSRLMLRFPGRLKCLFLLALQLLWVQSATAVLIPFNNCLDKSYQMDKPTRLQWVPLFVDASFDDQDDRHTLKLTMWGNVTGVATSENITLPAPGSPDWNDTSKHDGKIVGVPEPDSANPKVTTLFTNINVLTYNEATERTDFCNQSLKHGACPLGPVWDFNSTNGTNRDDLPYVTYTKDFYSSYAFSSFASEFSIVYGDSGNTQIGCVSATVTPDLGNLAWMLKFLPLIVLVFVGVATIFAAIFSPWGTSDVFHWTSNYGRDPDLLRLVTPGFGDCLQYIQFVVLTGGLTLNYPGFYQPIVSQGSWSALMFNQSFVSGSPGWTSLRDGIYFTEGKYGLQRLAHLVGVGEVEDIWAGMMVWLMAIIGAVFVLTQGAFLIKWLYRSVRNVPEEDLRHKNLPFTLGNVVRLVLNYFLLPIVALSTFQLVVATHSPAYTVALAVVTLVLIIGFAAWLLHLIATSRPRAFLFDDLPTVLLYGPLYNTYSDEAAAFALIPVFLSFLRGIAIGAVQPAGVAQVVLLAICEIIQILTLHAFRPFHSPTSMNAYHTLFSGLRLVSILMMVAFVPSLEVQEGPKGWVGYAILVIHAGVLVLGFFLNAVQTIVEVVARLLGAGGDDVRGQSRGGLSKIFGMRQLSRRMARPAGGPIRHSQLSSSAMLDTDETFKTGYVLNRGHIRSDSAGSMGLMTKHHRHSSSGLEDVSLNTAVRNLDNGSFTPTTPGEASTFSFAASAQAQGRSPSAFGMPTVDPYFRPPRRRTTIESAYSPGAKPGGSWTSVDWSQKRLSQSGAPLNDAAEFDPQMSRSATPGPYMIAYPPRTDYTTREVDYYYGLRGERLNSDAPSRKLGTGPADPTGPMASAAGWLRNILGRSSKEKGKGFEVVRSARMPPAMRTGAVDYEDESPPEGIPVAMGVIRNGPIESDEEDNVRQANADRDTAAPTAAEAVPLRTADDTNDDVRDDTEPYHDSEGLPAEPDLATVSQSSRAQTVTRRGNRTSNEDNDPSPLLSPPRRSSKRNSYHHTRTGSGSVSNTPLPAQPVLESGPQQQQTRPASSLAVSARLPFERTNSQKRLSSSSIGVSEDLSSGDAYTGSRTGSGLNESYGFVNQGNVNRVEQGHEPDLLGSVAEVGIIGRDSSRGSSQTGNTSRYSGM